jgi:hypothetical protein
MIEIVIWISPCDLDDLEKTLNRLNIGQEFLLQYQKSSIKFSIALGVSDEIINWNKSQVTKQECVDRFLNLKTLTKWAGESNFIVTDTINGCTSMRNKTSNSNSEWFLWLDTDIIFDPKTLPHMLNAIGALETNNITEFVITPEIVRQWDDTWDCLVNDNFINKPLGYQAQNNPHIDSQIIQEDFELIEVRNTSFGQPYMKFAGGWFTVLSKKLLELTPFPTDYGHYGLDDTYIMWAAQILNKPNIKQFKLKNLIVCENYFDRITTYKDKIEFIDRREEYKKYNENLFNISLQNLSTN